MKRHNRPGFLYRSSARMWPGGMQDAGRDDVGGGDVSGLRRGISSELPAASVPAFGMLAKKEETGLGVTNEPLVNHSTPTAH